MYSVLDWNCNGKRHLIFLMVRDWGKIPAIRWVCRAKPVQVSQANKWRWYSTDGWAGAWPSDRGAGRSWPRLGFENFSKKGCFLSFEWEKQISPLLATLQKNHLKKYTSGPPGKNSSDTREWLMYPELHRPDKRWPNSGSQPYSVCLSTAQIFSSLQQWDVCSSVWSSPMCK